MGLKKGVCVQYHVDGRMRTVSECEEKPGSIRAWISEVKFADDCVLLSHGRKNFDMMVKEFAIVTALLKMNMKRYKTTAMRVGRLEKRQHTQESYCRKQVKDSKDEKPLTVKQEGRDVLVHWDNEIKHLGSWISNDETSGGLRTIRQRFVSACKQNE